MVESGLGMSNNGCLEWRRWWNTDREALQKLVGDKKCAQSSFLQSPSRLPSRLRLIPPHPPPPHGFSASPFLHHLLFL